LVAAAGNSLAASSPTATLAANKHVDNLPAVTYGSSITLSGQETLSGSHPYVVQAQAWPFTKAFTTITSGTTTGSYSYVVTPDHATRYRVVVANGPTSPVLTVYVLDRELSFSCNLCNSNNKPGTATLNVTERFRRPPGLIANTGPGEFYYALNSSTVKPSILNLVSTASRQISGHTYTLTISYTVHFPNAPHFSFAEKFCVKHNEPKDGVGLPGHHGCGSGNINRLLYTG
jgi:hypothetical protein